MLKDVCSMAFSVRMGQAADTWALGPDSPCFAQKCYEIKDISSDLFFIFYSCRLVTELS